MTKYLTTLLVLALFPALLVAQTRNPNAPDDVPEDEEDVPTRVVLWEFASPQGEFKVKVASIQSVSMQTYIVDSFATVYEVNVATGSPIQARFYYIEATTPEVPSQMGQHAINTVRDRLTQLQKRVDGADLLYQVQKKHPETTHAKTVEYRLRSKKDLERVYKSVEKSFRSQRARKIKLYAGK